MTLEEVVRCVVEETHGEHLRMQIAKRVLSTIKSIHQSRIFKRDLVTAHFEAESPTDQTCLGVYTDTIELTELANLRKPVECIVHTVEGGTLPCTKAANFKDFKRPDACSFYQLGNILHVNSPEQFLMLDLVYVKSVQLSLENAESWVLEDYDDFVYKSVLAWTMQTIGDNTWQFMYQESKTALRNLIEFEESL